MGRGWWRARGAAFAAGLLPALLATVAAQADPDALWRIVHGRCVPDMTEHAEPAPCAAVSLAGGYAVLKDIVGATQFLVIPTARVSGIEDPAVLQPDAPDWFADAWQARHLAEARLGHALPRGAVALAVNAVSGRSQNQLHVHVDCLRADVAATLSRLAPAVGPAWAPLPAATPTSPAPAPAPAGGAAPEVDAGTAQGTLPGTGSAHWQAMRVTGDSLAGVRPFLRLADGLGARADMGEWTLVVVGTGPAEAPGFLLLADHADLAAGDRGNGEALQDHACALGRQ